MTVVAWIFILLAVPVATGVAAWRIKQARIADRLQLTGALITLISGFVLALRVFKGSPLSSEGGLFYVDALSAFNIVLISMVGFIAAFYSIGYMRHETAEGVVDKRQLGQYYLLYHLFIFTMLMVSVVNNLGILWAGIELTTLVSALLVAFYKQGTALEAAWKYLMMASVGIAFALLGIIFLYMSGIHLLGENPGALNWTLLNGVAGQLSPQWIKIAFIFILVGFGTKAGLAPMHFWLPDAHSQAPSPISAVLSGVLLNTALYGILRVFTIAHAAIGDTAPRLLVFFGLLSVAVTIPFILVQRDLKRMLAYSSVEHMGIITLGIGIGGPIGYFGAVLHMLGHAMAKSLLFFAAGSIVQKYHSKQTERISGVLGVMPVTGPIFVLGIIAITGSPPFGLFISEFTIMRAGWAAGRYPEIVLFAFMLVLIFAGMIYYAAKMAFGEAPAKLPIGEVGRLSAAALFFPLIAVLVLGLYVPPFLSSAIDQVSAVLQGGYSK